MFYRTNFSIDLGGKNNKSHVHLIRFREFPDISKVLDYRFFINTKAIVTAEGLVLLDEYGNPQKDYYYIRGKRRLKLSKRRRTKFFVKE